MARLAGSEASSGGPKRGLGSGAMNDSLFPVGHRHVVTVGSHAGGGRASLLEHGEFMTRLAVVRRGDPCTWVGGVPVSGVVVTEIVDLGLAAPPQPMETRKTGRSASAGSTLDV